MSATSYTQARLPVTALLFFITLCAGAQTVKRSLVTGSSANNIYRPAQLAVTDALVKGLRVPPGFTVTRFATGLGKPRMMAVGEPGFVYVTDREAGTVTLLRDADKNGVADQIQIIATKPQMHGIAIHDKKVYLVTVNEVYTADINPDGRFDSLKLIIDDLPDGGQHGNRTIEVGADGLLYISVGSTCNACKETNPENATLLQVKPDGSGRRIFAKGLRNTIGFAWHTTTQVLYGFDHGIDGLGDDEQVEELNAIEDGGDYGWPYIYGNGRFEKHHDPPGATHEEYAKRTKMPVLGYTAHAAPLDLIFYTGSAWPAGYTGDALVTMHGSWNRQTPSGYKVVRVHFSNGKPVKIEDFMTGFLVNNNTARFGRPCGLVQLPDGSILVLMMIME